ncbi:MAG TPA: hypothetical protein VGK36_21225 [Candidatus Angelobacter sp.]|jgi:hypothetical protein
MYVLLALILLQAASPSIQPKQPVVKNSEPKQKAENSTKTQETVPVTSPAAAQIGQSSPAQKENSHQPEAKNGPNPVNETVSKPLDWPFLVYLVITALIAYFTFRTLKAVQTQGALMADQLKEMQTAREQTIAEMKNAGLQTDRLISQAQVSAEAAKRSADAFKDAERPWILVTLKEGIHDGSYRETKDGKYETLLYFEWFLSNLGRTPALVYEIQAYFDVLSNDKVDKLMESAPEGKPLRPDRFLVAPGKDHECPGITKIGYWTNEERKAVMKRDSFLVAYGRVKYRNVIAGDETHETPFIGIYQFVDGEFKQGRFKRWYSAKAFNQYT